jgi:DNA-directed RNA polymerase specialized sigma24 family protein
MCFLDQDDLHKIVSDEKRFSAFTLLQREREIIFARVVKGIKYKHLAPAFNITISRTQYLYKRGIEKMKEQIIDRLGND